MYMIAIQRSYMFAQFVWGGGCGGGGDGGVGGGGVGGKDAALFTLAYYSQYRKKLNDSKDLGSG